MIADLVRSTFFNGGPGEILFQFALIAAVSYALIGIAQAVNQGPIAGYIRTLTGVVCVGMVIYKIFEALNAIAKAGAR